MTPSRKNLTKRIPEAKSDLKPLKGRVALVAGATRGVGRGIAHGAGRSRCDGLLHWTKQSIGAERQCSARPRRGETRRKGTPKAMAGGILRGASRNDRRDSRTCDGARRERNRGRCRSSGAGASGKVVARIRAEQGKLNILVNDISESAEYEFGQTFWNIDLERGFAMFRNAIHTHIITSRFAAPLMIESAKASGTSGLIVEIGDGDSYVYRGHLIFDMVKTTVIRLAFAMARELRRKNVAAIALTPGFLRSEVMLERFGVTEANWRDAVKNNPDYAISETPLYAGRAVAALAEDPDIMKKSGRVFSTWGLSDEYAFTDADGSRPHWGRHFEEKYGKTLKPCDEEFYTYWKGGPIDTMFADWP